MEFSCYCLVPGQVISTVALLEVYPGTADPLQSPANLATELKEVVLLTVSMSPFSLGCS